MLSEQVLRICSRFGIEPRSRDVAGLRRERAAGVAGELLKLGAGTIAMVTGPSGGGKTLIMRALGRARGVRRYIVAPARLCERPQDARVIDQFNGPLSEALAALARAGLSEAHLIAGELGALSDGQRFRLALAVALHRAARDAGRRAAGGPPPLILVDEFASTLDRTTAKNIARTLRRCIASCGARAVVATAHDDVLEPLAPDILVWQPLWGGAMVLREERP
jgi:ABC-type ATPase with predicted acetyltransferase domain